MDTNKDRLKRQGRVLLVAPLVVVPLVSLLVGVVSDGVGKDSAGTGLNLNLPGAHLKEEKGLNKMAYYKKADADSLEQEKKRKTTLLLLPGIDTANGLKASPDANELKVTHKVAELKGLMSEGLSGRAVRKEPVMGAGGSPTAAGADLDRLERMMKLMRSGDNSPDPEMRELNRTLDKLMAVQHPGMVKDSPGVSTVAALPVSPAPGGVVINNWTTPTAPSNRFYDLESSGAEADEGAMIEATVPETQTLVNGAFLRLELGTDLAIRGDRIPRGTALYGITQLSNERLVVKVSAIRCREKVYPVALQVVDQDGLAGIYEPGSMTREAARESTGESIGSIGSASLDPSIGGQAASAGIQLARSLAGKKIRQVRVTVKTGYRVFLEDMSQKH